jgi:hypothetical protein
MVMTRTTLWSLGLMAVATLVAETGAAPRASSVRGSMRRPCSATAAALYVACKAQTVDDAFVAKAKCLNVTDAQDRTQCLNDLETERADATATCREMRQGRRDACRLLGENPYDPKVDQTLFDDPHALVHANPYFPLTIGNHWEYRSTGETDTVDIVDEIKLINRVQCVVARDIVEKPTGEAEHTNDWYAQAKDGNTWYFGEETADLATFPGDDPQRLEVVTIEGSFKWGRDRDKGGIIFLASPKVGDAYLEEFSLANAEDVTEVLSTTYSYGAGGDLDMLVPAALAQTMCAGDCVVTKNYSLLEPGVFARKYYARGIGVFLEVEVQTGEVVQLVDCNFDARCAALPQP